MALQKAMVSSKSNEWSTPQALFDELDKEFHFDLDVASTDENTKCYNHYTQEDNGLIQPWHAVSKSACFMNPPYGGHTKDWIKKAYEESLLGATVVCLIVSSSDRSYWHDYIFPFAYEIRFLRGRLKFGTAKSTAPFASAIVIFNGINTQTQPKITFYRKSSNSKTMKQYSVFYEADGRYYPIYEDKNGKWWLGGSRLYCPLFFSRKEAEKCVKIIKEQNYPFFNDGKVVVKRAVVAPY